MRSKTERAGSTIGENALLGPSLQRGDLTRMVAVLVDHGYLVHQTGNKLTCWMRADGRKIHVGDFIWESFGQAWVLRPPQPYLRNFHAFEKLVAELAHHARGPPLP